MFKKINLQFLLSYLGFFPFLIILLDNFFFNILNINIVKDFLIFYSIIIFVFIGAVNWNLKKNVPIKIILTGFMPSFFSLLIIIMFLNSYEVINYLIFLFIIQLIGDYFIYREKNNRFVLFQLRIPLTLSIIFSLIFIQL